MYYDIENQDPNIDLLIKILHLKEFQNFLAGKKYYNNKG